MNVMFNLKKAFNLFFAVNHSDLRWFNKSAINSGYESTLVSLAPDCDTLTSYIRCVFQPFTSDLQTKCPLFVSRVLSIFCNLK